MKYQLLDAQDMPTDLLNSGRYTSPSYGDDLIELERAAGLAIEEHNKVAHWFYSLNPDERAAERRAKTARNTACTAYRKAYRRWERAEKAERQDREDLSYPYQM